MAPTPDPAESESRAEPRAPLISEVRVRNFRSIVDATVEPGRLTVIVGANGSGKSNLLEALAVGSAESAGKLGHEFLAARGIRPMLPELLRPRFPDVSSGPTELCLAAGELRHQATIDFGRQGELESSASRDRQRLIRRLLSTMRPGEIRQRGNDPDWPEEWFAVQAHPGGGLSVVTSASAFVPGLADFLIYTPDYTALRTFSDEGQILPLGIRGEGLFKHLVDLSRRHPEILASVGERLRVLDWFDGFVLPGDLGPGEKRLAIRDRYLEQDIFLDQRAANEGFLFLLFVHVVLSSPYTPRFFAIDNADTSLNPKLCARLVADIAELARENDKQIVLTTHNPAMLDGLDLADDQQRLLVCERDLDGHTTFRRIPAPSRAGTRLSEAFLRGYLGGLPGSF